MRMLLHQYQHEHELILSPIQGKKQIRNNRKKIFVIGHELWPRQILVGFQQPKNNPIAKNKERLDKRQTTGILKLFSFYGNNTNKSIEPTVNNNYNSNTKSSNCKENAVANQFTVKTAGREK